MKIYPSTHKIKTVTDTHVDTALNIPLAYINVDYSKYKIDKFINDRFNKEEKRPLIINDSFDNMNLKLFNDYGEEVNASNLFTHTNDKYVYYPSNLINFNPKTFLWKATIRKNLEYSISNSYDINIKCYDEWVNSSIDTILTNPSERALVPPNIKINNNKMNHEVFTDISSEKADFMLIKNVHGGYYDIDCTKPINIYDYLDTHTNIWIASDDPRSIHPDYGIVTADKTIEYKISNPILNSNSTIHCNTYFNLGVITQKAGIKVHNIFNDSQYAPILVLEYENSGFLILSHSSILRDSTKCYPIIFETIMYAYLNSYASTNWIKEWITYKVPDYEVVNNNIQAKKSFISNVSLNSYFNINGTNMIISSIKIINDDSAITSISNNDIVDSISAVKCIGKINNKLLFELDSEISIDGYTEPTKPIGWKSVYMDGQIFYLSDIHYLVTNDITNKIFLIENKDSLIVKVYAFRNSILGINTKKDLSLTIPFVKTENESIVRVKEASYSVFIKNGKIDYCYTEDYNTEIEDQYELFVVKIGQTKEAIQTHDIRQLGGGLPEEEQDNYNLFDIGHINGRPYRPNGTLVITMPTKYEKYKDIILKSLQKYMVGEDYPVIFFEDKEE